jgi:hypothetical protein
MVASISSRKMRSQGTTESFPTTCKLKDIQRFFGILKGSGETLGSILKGFSYTDPPCRHVHFWQWTIQMYPTHLLHAISPRWTPKYPIKLVPHKYPISRCLYPISIPIISPWTCCFLLTFFVVSPTANRWILSWLWSTLAPEIRWCWQHMKRGMTPNLQVQFHPPSHKTWLENPRTKWRFRSLGQIIGKTRLIFNCHIWKKRLFEWIDRKPESFLRTPYPNRVMVL